jgi:hypothetical protein
MELLDILITHLEELGYEPGQNGYDNTRHTYVCKRAINRMSGDSFIHIINSEGHSSAFFITGLTAQWTKLARKGDIDFSHPDALTIFRMVVEGP